MVSVIAEYSAMVAEELELLGEETGGVDSVVWKLSAVCWSGTVTVRRIGTDTCAIGHHFAI